MLWTIPAPDCRQRQPTRVPRLYDRAIAAFDAACAAEKHVVVAPRTAGYRTSIAYFSAEFALHQCCRFTQAAWVSLPAITVKKRRGLGVPLIGVGFMYPQGYFHQQVVRKGWQEEVYERLDWLRAPIAAGDDAGRQACITAVPLDRSNGARLRVARAVSAACGSIYSTRTSKRTLLGS